MKDPAFLFYTQDFIVGVQTMPFEDRGKYITILCQMHQQGRMDEETISFLVGSISDKLKGKFKIDNQGLWFNERLEIEMGKRRGFVDSRRENGSKGGRPKKPSAKPSAKPNGYPKKNLSEDVNEDEIDNKDVNKIVYAEFVKLTETEYNKLVSEHNESNTKIFISILDNYKGANGKVYKSDYRAILNWVIDRAKADGKYKGKSKLSV